MSTNYGTTNAINDYRLKPRNLTQYTAFRGVTDFTQIGQFAQFEGGYRFLSVIQMPRFLEVLGQENSNIANMVNSFKHMLEYEFRGIDGLADITADYMEITDGINTQSLISKVNWDTNVTISSEYFEKTGNLIAGFTELYLTGIKDKMSQAKTYHGLIKDGKLEPGPENEVFTMLYYVTDNTMLRLERAVLLCNCQLTTSRLSDILNGDRSDIGNNKPMQIEWRCFPVTGVEVDKAAKSLLEDITGVNVTYRPDGTTKFTVVKEEDVAALDSSSYKYAVLNKDDKSGTKIDALVDAVEEQTDLNGNTYTAGNGFNFI